MTLWDEGLPAETSN